jgi:hypothetical protein
MDPDSTCPTSLGSLMNSSASKERVVTSEWSRPTSPLARWKFSSMVMWARRPVSRLEVSCDRDGLSQSAL